MDYEKKYLKYKLKYLSLLKNTEGGVGVAKLNKKKNLEKCIIECKNKYDSKLKEEEKIDVIQDDDSESNKLLEGITETIGNTGSYIADTFNEMISNDNENKQVKTKENLVKRENKLVLDKDEFNREVKKKNNRDKLVKKMNNHKQKKIKRSFNLRKTPDVPHGERNLEYVYKKEKLRALMEHRKNLMK